MRRVREIRLRDRILNVYIERHGMEKATGIATDDWGAFHYAL